MNLKKASTHVSLALVILLAGCAVGPDYKKPEVSAPTNWNSAMKGGLKSASPDTTNLTQWWNGLNDPYLSRMVNEAITNNLDIKMAQARLREARARRGVSSADRFPTLSASTGANRSRSSEAMGSGGGNESETWSAKFDASWELDIFGGKRRALEAATATMQASQEDLRDV